MILIFLSILIFIDYLLSIYTSITCIVHELGALRVANKTKSWVHCILMSSSKSIHILGQFFRDYSVIPPNWKDDLSWSFRWFPMESALVCTIID